MNKSIAASVKYTTRSIAICLQWYLLFFVLITSNTFAQVVPPDNDNIIQQQLENAAENAPENADLTELTEVRAFFLKNQIELNTATRTEIGALEMLNDLQVEALFKHIRLNGELIALEELQAIEGFDLATIRMLLPYITLGNGVDYSQWNLNNILKNSKNELIIRGTQVLEDQKGYNIPDSDVTSNRYLGSPLRFYTRYRFTSGRKLSFGITAEKDAGEEFFQGSQKSFDFYSGHLMIRDLGVLRAFVIGDYQLAYGQGLVLWSGLAPAKSADVMQIKRNAIGIRAHTSVNEFSLFRGTAAALGYKNFQIDLFYSNRKLDANFASADTVNDLYLLSSVSEDGYHRTKSEVEDKNRVKQLLYGCHIKFEKGALEIGGTYYFTKIDVPIAKKTEPYNQYDFYGTQFQNFGVDYTYQFQNINFFGEVAATDNGAVSYLNGALISLDPRVSFSIFNRHYARDYVCAACNPLRESSPQNESGTYAGLSLQLFSRLKAVGYIDVFKFPWLKYQVSAPSQGYELLGQLTYTPSKKTEFYFRYRKTVKQENISGDIAPIDQLRERKQNNYRFNIVYKFSNTIRMQSRVEFDIVKMKNIANSDGYVLFQDINYSPLTFPFSFSLRYGLFDTDNYDSRIYAFENDIPGVYAIPSYYYRGSRFYIMARYDITKGISFWIRYGRSLYANQKTVGSGLDEIDANHKSDLKMQLRFTF